MKSHQHRPRYRHQLQQLLSLQKKVKILLKNFFNLNLILIFIAGLKRKRKREELAKEKEELKEAIEEMKRISSEAITEFQNGQQNIERQVTDIGRNIDSLVRLLTNQAQDSTSSFGSLQNYFHL